MLVADANAMNDADDERGQGLATITAVAGSSKPRAAAVPARLRAVWPPEVDWHAALDRPVVTVGRVAGERGEPPLLHETVSRRHLEVSWDARAGAHVAVDLGSHNGSRVGGGSVGDAAVPLANGAILQLGDVCVVYESGLGLGAEASAAAADVAPDAVPGDAPAQSLLRAAVGRCARDPSPVLVLGETGTGKEWVAREIHRLSGRTGAFVAINCSALSDQIVDSQLFGHLKGAFTGASADHPGVFRAADGGTLFLDEIGELPLSLQPKLLRALQEGEVQPVGSTKTVGVDVRIVAATNQPLSEHVDAGTFRRDLYARLALWELRMPPLRERRGDLIAWITRLHRAWTQRRPHVPAAALAFTPEAAEAILLYDWPNNLRDVDRLVHELSAAQHGEAITVAQLPHWISRDTAGDAQAAPTPTQAQRARPVPTREEFAAVFEQLHGNVRALAKHFARDRRQIYRWIEAHGLGDRRAPGKP